MNPIEVMSYKPGWYLIEMVQEAPLIRFFNNGQSYLCDPRDFFQHRLNEHGGSETELGEFQNRFAVPLKQMISCGPISQYDPETWDAVKYRPEFFIAKEE